MLADLRTAGGIGDGAASGENDRLAEMPEVRAKISEMMAAHWEHWVDQPLPILGNRTPMEAEGCGRTGGCRVARHSGRTVRPQRGYANGRGCVPAVAREAGSRKKPEQFENGFLYKQLSNRGCIGDDMHIGLVDHTSRTAQCVSPSAVMACAEPANCTARSTAPAGRGLHPVRLTAIGLRAVPRCCAMATGAKSSTAVPSCAQDRRPRARECSPHQGCLLRNRIPSDSLVLSAVRGQKQAGRLVTPPRVS